MSGQPYYQDEQVTLYHGDCLEVTEWLNADVLVTDPPYGINHSHWNGNAPVIAGERRTGRASDRLITDEDVAVRDATLTAWSPKPGLVFGSWRAPKPQRTRMRMVWEKPGVLIGGVGVWRSGDEEIYIVGNWPNARHEAGSTTESHSSIIRMRTPRGDLRPDHPTPKPLGLMEYLLRFSPDGVIADPFAGSGSTLIAARNLGRQAIGVEIEERYCELIARRLDQMCLNFEEGA